jgi:hypothetical protein
MRKLNGPCTSSAAHVENPVRWGRERGKMEFSIKRQLPDMILQFQSVLFQLERITLAAVVNPVDFKKKVLRDHSNRIVWNQIFY